MDSILRNNKLWFGLAFTLALFVRLLRLGEVPLSDSEAVWALQAFNLVRGQAVEFGPQPGYVNLTAFFFFVLQASDFAARLTSALAGSALVLAPALFRERLGGKTAIVLAFLLALDPGLLAISRQAGSPILAIALALLAWGLWRSGKTRLAGFLAGLALLSGSALWFGLLAIGLAFVLMRVLSPNFMKVDLARADLTRAFYFGLGAYLIFGSFFLFAPGGLGAGLAALTDFVARLVGSSAVPFWLPLLSLVFYQFPALLLALVSLLRLFARRDDLAIFLGLWLFFALLAAILPAGRQVADLGWALIPLYALAALEVVRWLSLPEPIVDYQPSLNDDVEPTPLVVSRGLWETLGMALLTVIMSLFAWLNLASAALITFDPTAVQLRWVLVFGALALLALSTFLVAFGWSIRAAFKGLAWGGLAVLTINLLAMASFAAQIRPLPTVETWPAVPQSPSMRVIQMQAAEISEMARGANFSLDIVLVGIDSPALRWALRDWRLSSAQAVSIDADHDLILTPGESISPELEATYRGASFSLYARPAWEQMTLSEWLRWMIRHEAPKQVETVIFWARSDLFPDSQIP